jgi:hypothetical protein
MLHPSVPCILGRNGIFHERKIFGVSSGAWRVARIPGTKRLNLLTKAFRLYSRIQRSPQALGKLSGDIQALP